MASAAPLFQNASVGLLVGTVMVTAIATFSVLCTVVITTPMMFSSLSDKQQSLTPYYNGPQDVTPVYSMQLDDLGRVSSYVIGSNVTVNGTINGPILTYGPLPGIPDSAEVSATSPVEFNVAGPSAVISLASQGVAGVYTNPNVTVSDEGIITAITDGGGSATVNGPFLAYGPLPGIPDSAEVSATSPVQFNVSGSSAVISLVSQGVAGSYSRADITVNDEGIITAAADSPPITAADVSFGGGTAEDALNSNFVVAQASPDLPGAQVLDPNDDAFIHGTGNGTFAFTLRPRPLIGTVCTYPTQITFDSQFGLAETCMNGPTPGTPGGAAVLDGMGKVPISQLPDALVTSIDFLGLWDADTNTPFLDNATCGAFDTFYYIVSVSGNTTLGTNTNWLESDTAFCVNGTWDQISGTTSGVTSFNGRAGIVLPELGDYDASQVTFGGGTVDVLGGYPIVTYGATPELAGASLLAGTADQVVVAGSVISLSTKANFPLASNVINGFVNFIDIDQNGRVTDIGTGMPLENIYGTPNQVIVTGTTNLTLSTPQDLAPTSDVAFNSVQIGDTIVTSAANSTINLELPLTEGEEGQVIRNTGNGGTEWGYNTEFDYNADTIVGTIIGTGGVPSTIFSISNNSPQMYRGFRVTMNFCVESSGPSASLTMFIACNMGNAQASTETTNDIIQTTPTCFPKTYIFNPGTTQNTAIICDFRILTNDAVNVHYKQMELMTF